MTLIMGFFTFLNLWWITLFLVMPFGVTVETKPNAGDYVAAPRAMKWKKIFLINTILSLIITLMLAAVIKSGIVPLHNLLTDNQ